MMTSVWLLSSALLVSSPAAAASKTSARPNIVLIVGDDLGYADLGCQGGPDVRTPRIDSLAANGIRFTNGYVSCPVCSPSRAGLLTGRYQERFGHEFNPGKREQVAPNFGLPLDQVTLADDLKRAGYVTGCVGKWHLGQKEPFHPQRRGFDEFFGFLHGSHSYLDARADASNPLFRGTQPLDREEYLTDAFGREALAFLDRHADQPFFLYLAFNAVHLPQEALPKYLERFGHVQDRKRRMLLAMLSAMDDAVGRVLDRLREKGLEENTLVIFISDNGAPTEGNGSRNDPLRGYKGQVLEGGIRVPFIVQWQGRLPGGKTFEQPVIALDILPTVLAAAGVQVSAERKLDGVDLLPYLAGRREGVPHEALYWRFGPQAAVRKGDWKLIRSEAAPPQLYNLASDAGEQHDLAGDQAERVKELEAMLNNWNAQLTEPRWRGYDRGAGELRPDRAARKPGRAEKGE